jgi:hypothetical protein
VKESRRKIRRKEIDNEDINERKRRHESIKE